MRKTVAWYLANETWCDQVAIVRHALRLIRRQRFEQFANGFHHLDVFTFVMTARATICAMPLMPRRLPVSWAGRRLRLSLPACVRQGDQVAIVRHALRLIRRQRFEQFANGFHHLDVFTPNKPQGVAHYRDLIAFVADRPGHDLRYAIDASKIG
jgi:hypothetical protein